ncbi:quinolinate synthase NadA [Urinicoccus massiliensis]|uniref:quinolinate synthase NadA n=1 Tax=Urinicoccus massiliensis TaxID=1723382 RepID=UPI000930051C|nr:quinolinate synthase NadA [Urinicoccus massiliensis]
MENKELLGEIEELKLKKDALILAHYYVDGDLQEVADFVGDSYALAKKAVASEKKRIVFCGVKFMGESAKLLNPHKRVFLVDKHALCPMADMITGRDIEEYRREYKHICVVTYINSTAETKAHSDVCVTSSNALRIVKKIQADNILLCPDKNLGTYIKSQLKDDLKDKNVLIHDGYCHVHEDFTYEAIQEAKAKHPKAPVLVHPEINPACYDLADYIGSTSGILKEARERPEEEFIICTERGILHQLQKDSPHKKFYFTDLKQVCYNMKMLNLEKLRDCLRDDLNEVFLDEDVMEKASRPLKKMLEMAE